MDILLDSLIVNTILRSLFLNHDVFMFIENNVLLNLCFLYCKIIIILLTWRNLFRFYTSK